MKPTKKQKEKDEDKSSLKKENLNIQQFTDKTDQEPASDSDHENDIFIQQKFKSDKVSDEEFLEILNAKFRLCKAYAVELRKTKEQLLKAEREVENLKNSKQEMEKKLEQERLAKEDAMMRLENEREEKTNLGKEVVELKLRLVEIISNVTHLNDAGSRPAPATSNNANKGKKSLLPFSNNN
jgi:hypothetical protein